MRKQQITWQTKKLGDILKLEYGKPLPDSKRKRDGAYPAYGANGEKNRTDEYYYNKKSIIVGRKGSAGEIKLTEEKFWPLDVTYFVTFDHEKYNLKFLYYLLTHLELPKLAKGVKPGINRNEVYSLQVRVPPLAEQQRIVTILDSAFTSIASAKENMEKTLQNTSCIIESFLSQIFSNLSNQWKIKKISDIFTIKPPKKEARDKLSNDDFVSFVPMEDLGILTKEFITIKERKLKEVSGSYTYFSENDLLLAKITPCFENGKIGIARNLKNGVGFGSSEYIVFRSNGELLPDFLYYFLARDQFRHDGKKMMSGAVGHKRVSMEFIENLKITYPESIKEQRFVVAKLDELSTKSKMLRCIYQNKLNHLNELKKSILRKTFSSQLATKKIEINTKVHA